MSKSLKCTSRNLCSKFIILALALMVIGSICLDQLTKSLAESHLMVWSDSDNLKAYQGKRLRLWTLGEEISPVYNKDPRYLSLSFNYVRNQGAAWGMFSDWDDNIRVPFFYIITFFAVLLILFYLKTTPPNHLLARFALTLILSGAIGNVYDRFLLGYVIDFIDVRWALPLPFHLNFSTSFFPDFLGFLNIKVNTSTWQYDFPNFNWADSMITIGVSLLLYDMIFLEPSRQKTTAEITPQGTSEA